jgi:single-stranded-DNA-specific exonuclease recJ
MGVEMAKWMLAARKADFDAIAQKFHISPVLARILRNRDLVTEQEIDRFLNGTLADLHDPSLLKGMQEAGQCLFQKIGQRVKIRIIGDYDVDGVCSVYILLRGLRLLGADVDTVIPHRMKDGYGLNDHLIEQAKEDGIDTILTCDNGIAAADQIRLANTCGMTVIVTDHHEVPYEEQEGERIYRLPPAAVVIDPKQEDCPYPYKQICGAVVAYKLIRYLFREAQKIHWTGWDGEPVDEQAAQALLQELLSFTALATVCDVMELRDENRILVREGLKEMAKTTNYGLKALLQVNDLYGKPLTPYHAGFVIGPCLNATGRLDTAKRALELFDASSIEEAALIASDLKSMNESRKQMTEDGVKLATQQVEQELSGDDILVVYLPDCHESLAGIIAGRIREKYHRPVFVLTSAEEGVKGSGRSIEAYSMYEEMNKVKELFARFGGHRQAAGLTLAAEDGFSDAQLADRFRKALNANSTLKSEDFEEVVHIDVPLPLKLADRNFLAELEKLEPFGTGNPKPLFARKQISILSMAKLGKTGKFRRIRIADEQGNPYQAVYFGDGEEMDRYLMQKYGEERLIQGFRGGLMQGQMEISIVYSPQINSYNGRESIQILIQYYQ